MAQNRITTSQLAWTAGIIDLQGHVIVKNNKDRSTNTRQVVLYVETKHFPIVRRLNALTGTKAELKNELPLKDFMRKVCGEHCPSQHSHVESPSENRSLPPVARWAVTGASAAIVLQNILPYLVDEKDYPELVNSLISQTVLSGQGSGQTLRSIRRMILLGWKVPKIYNSAME